MTSSLASIDELHSTDKSEKAPLNVAGTAPAHRYSSLLRPRLRGHARNYLITWVEWETPHLARMQARYRSPALDQLFLVTAALGSHSAYLLGLPLFFWFHDGSLGRPLLYALALSVYTSSWCKDALCLPRPYSPPVTRLSIGNHALEYGWPSTHSATAVATSLPLGIAIFPHLTSSLQQAICAIILILYALSVILGRLYCGMHSMTIYIDCTTGVVLGFISTLTIHYGSPAFDTFCRQDGFLVPATLVPIALIMVSCYPQPIDNCPCFEDAVAFIAVSLGLALSVNGTPWTGGIPRAWSHLWPSIAALAVIRVVLGTGIVFVWRILAKKTMHAVLPPLIRRVSPIIELPRRHYRKASDYISYEGKEADVKAVPSLFDLSNLPEHVEGPVKALTNGSAAPVTAEGKTTATQGGQSLSPRLSRARSASAASLAKAFTPSTVHYDADVLTKLVVYSGIGYIACYAVPRLFVALGLSD